MPVRRSAVFDPHIWVYLTVDEETGSFRALCFLIEPGGHIPPLYGEIIHSSLRGDGTVPCRHCTDIVLDGNGSFRRMHLTVVKNLKATLGEEADSFHTAAKVL